MRVLPLKPVHAHDPPHRGGWLAALGKLGFLFFLVKGLCWLILPPLFIWLGWKL